jgi:uncharacterized protein
LSGQMLVLPVGNTFLYVQPIYLQATNARMPQLKKVVLGLGNHLIYADTYEEGLARLGGLNIGLNITLDNNQRPVVPGGPAVPTAISVQTGTVQTGPMVPAAKLDSIREHLRKYRELQGQGRWSDAGKELEAIETELKR